LKIFYCIKELIPKTSLNRRVGKALRRTALLRVVFDDGLEGFANLHPNPERLGTTLEQELALLSKGNPSVQATQSLKLARWDAEARAAGKSLWEGVEIPPCHYLVTEFSERSLLEIENALRRGFRKFKIKTGRNLQEEIRLLNQLAETVCKGSQTLRPDFNQALSREDLKTFVQGASSQLVSAIDFVEDPTADRPEVWNEIGAQTLCKGSQTPCGGLQTLCKGSQIPWAWDQHSERVGAGDYGFSAVVVKPAIQDAEAVTSRCLALTGHLNLQIVFTSYMDHPVGQMGAAYIAAKFYKEHPEKRTECGLMSQDIFEPTPYSEVLQTNGCFLLHPQGLGIGFGDLLKKEDWKKLQ